MPDPHQSSAPRRRAGRRIGILGGALTAALFVVFLRISGGPVAQAAAARPGAPAVVLLTSDGEPFARRGALRAAPVRASALPPYVPQAFVAIEDRRFYRHGGVDPLGIARALWADLRHGGVVEGGSTITQQLVKNTELGPEQTLGRKLREATAALRIERRLSKDEILSRYLSTIYFGEGAYGLGAAAQTYFGKTPDELSLGEAAMLAGLVKAPTDLSPFRHLAQAQARERLVLLAMARSGYIDATTARLEPAAAPVEQPELDRFGGYFADWIYPSIARGLPNRFGAVSVRTTLDGSMQRRAEAVVDQALETYGGHGRVGQAALVAMRSDGTVLAMVGGRDHHTAPFNRAVQAKRQPGSTFKLFVYLAALRRGASPSDVVSDEPLRIGDWRPSNADHQNHGLLTLEDAFARSSNLAAVRVSQAVGVPAVVQTARELGISAPLDAVPSLALGASNVNLLELTSAYAAVARGAYPVRPFGVGAGSDSGRAMDPAVRADMLQLLHAAAARIEPAAELPFPVFGKTGTSQNFRDALFVGFAGDLVVGVWVGNDDERPMNQVYGGALPAKIWAEFMRTAGAGQADTISHGLPDSSFSAPDDEVPGPPPSPGLEDTFRSLFGL